MALMALVVQAASAYDFMAGDIAYNRNSDGKSVTVTYQNNSSPSYSSLSGAINIPESVTYSGKTYSVTSIGSSAFYGCSGLTSVNISDIVQWCAIEFGNYDANPLYYAHHLYLNGSEVTDLIIPNSVTEIGWDAFSGCTGLKSVTIGNSVTSIGNYAFWECSGLTSVTIGNSVTSIGEYAFYGTAWYNNQPDGLVYAGPVAYKYKGTMPSGTSIVLKEGTKGIAESAFLGCSGLTSVTIGNSVTSIGDNAFRGCSGLTSVTIGNSVTSIGERAFRDCSGLTSVTIPNSVTSIGESAFKGCTRLTNVTIPGSVTSIGPWAFSGCTGLTSVVWNAKICSDFSLSFFAPFKGLTNIKSFEVGNEVERIPAYLCSGLTGLTSVTIPGSVTSIGHYAFSGCTGLKNIFSKIEEPANVTMGSSVFYSIPKTTCILWVPEGTVKKYQAADQWKDFTNIVADLSDGVTGDVNGDGEVNVSDVVTLANFAMGETPEDFVKEAGDLNDDDEMNVSDVVILANIVIGV